MGDLIHPGHVVPVVVREADRRRRMTLSTAAHLLADSAEAVTGVFASVLSALDPIRLADDQELVALAQQVGLTIVEADPLAMPRWLTACGTDGRARAARSLTGHPP